MNHFRRAAAVLAAAALLGGAGCGSPSTAKYPSITFFGADNGIITSGTNGAGQPVQGTSTLTWQTRLADKVTLLATTVANGKSTTTTVATFKAGDTSSCTVNKLFPNSDCVKDGTYEVRPTQDTTYNIQATVGAGNCDRDPTLGTLLHPDQCDDLTADQSAGLTVVTVSVVPPSVLTLTVGGSATATVAPGTDVTADYTVTAASSFDFGVMGTDAKGNATYESCGTDGDQSAPCWYETVDATGSPKTTGIIKIPGVTASTVLTGSSTTTADDGLGGVSINSPGSTVTITVPGTPSVASFTATHNLVNPSTTGVSVALAWSVTDADTVTLQADSGSTGAVTGLSGCSGVDNTGAGACTVSITGTDGQSVTIDLVASNSTTGQTSPPASETILIGNPPTVTLTASPAELPAAGGNVTLTWTAPGATAVTLTDDGGSTVVDTTASPATNCDSGNPCDPAGDTITVSAVPATTTWTLTATNKFPGAGTQTATATVHPAPAVASFTVHDNAPGGGTADATTVSQMFVGADTALLQWVTTEVDPSTAHLDLATVPDTGGCAAVTSWSAAPGFTFSASGTYTLDTSSKVCFRFTYAGYAGQTGGNVEAAIYRKVVINHVTLNGVIVNNDSTTALTHGTSVTVDWSDSRGATQYSLLKAPGVANGKACSSVTTYQPVLSASTATNYLVTAPGAGNTDCYQVTASDPNGFAGQNQATYYVGIQGQ